VTRWLAGRLAGTVTPLEYSRPSDRIHCSAMIRSFGGPNRKPPPPAVDAALSLLTKTHSPGAGAWSGTMAATRVA
jgi:hypothetical protein